jgi:hypothetical protein
MPFKIGKNKRSSKKPCSNLSRQPAFALVRIGDSSLQDTLRLAHHRALYSRIDQQ